MAHCKTNRTQKSRTVALTVRLFYTIACKRSLKAGLEFCGDRRIDKVVAVD
jgi:hypothetical protein